MFFSFWGTVAGEIIVNKSLVQRYGGWLRVQWWHMFPFFFRQCPLELESYWFNYFLLVFSAVDLWIPWALKRIFDPLERNWSSIVPIRFPCFWGQRICRSIGRKLLLYKTLHRRFYICPLPIHPVFYK